MAKAKYFLNSSLSKAGRPGSRASVIWKSVCDARCVPEKGSRWKIGNGLSISAWHDRWLPRPTTFKPLSPCLDDNNLRSKVSDLLLPSGNWNDELIRNIFLPVDADIICSPPFSRMSVEDKLIWYYDKFGKYTTKSGFHIAKVIQDYDRSIGGVLALVRVRWLIFTGLKIFGS